MRSVSATDEESMTSAVSSENEIEQITIAANASQTSYATTAFFNTSEAVQSDNSSSDHDMISSLSALSSVSEFDDSDHSDSNDNNIMQHPAHEIFDSFSLLEEQLDSDVD